MTPQNQPREPLWGFGIILATIGIGSGLWVVGSILWVLGLSLYRLLTR